MSYSLFVLGTCWKVSDDKMKLTVEMHPNSVKWSKFTEKDPILMNIKFGTEKMRVRKWSSYPDFDRPGKDLYLIELSVPCEKIDRCPRNIHLEFFIEPLFTGQAT